MPFKQSLKYTLKLIIFFGLIKLCSCSSPIQEVKTFEPSHMALNYRYLIAPDKVSPTISIDSLLRIDLPKEESYGVLLDNNVIIEINLPVYKTPITYLLPGDIKRRPLFSINAKDKKLYYKHKIRSIDSLHIFVFESYFNNKYSDDNIQLKFRNKLPKKVLKKILKEIVISYLSVTNIKSQNMFSQNVSTLKQNQLDSLKEIVPLNILFLNSNSPTSYTSDLDILNP